MANVTETANWESGVYQFETTDPITGGPDGIDNLPHKQLANRTKYLKQFADEVAAARGTAGSLLDRLTAVDQNIVSLSPDMQNMVHAAVVEAVDLSGRAHDQIKAMRVSRIQQGEFTITNRGVVEGCTISKSTNATRNLNLAAGTCFANGRVYSVASGSNVASVPQNTGTGSVTVSAYLFLSNSAWSLATTAIGAAVPSDAIEIYRLTIPANSTDASDPNLTNVTLTDVRRVEPGFPLFVSSPAYKYQSINWLPDTNYHLRFDIVAATGAPCDPDAVVIASRAQNGFGINLASAADSVTVRWEATNMNF